MRNTITRTFYKNVCTCKLYVDGAVIDSDVVIPAGYNSVDLAEKYIRKNVQLSGKLIVVLSVKKDEKLYGMDESLFIENAVLVDARSKDTRDMVSKTVKGKVGTLVCADAEYNIHKFDIPVDAKRNLDKQAKENAPKGYIGIKIENVRDFEGLFVMSEEKFIGLARPMKDHQHYING